MNKVTRTLADGSKQTYYYFRATGARLSGVPWDAEFEASYEAAKASLRVKITGTLEGLVRDFEATAKWRRLAESTKTEYRRVLKFWLFVHGDAPHAALEDKGFRRAVLAWHDDFSAEKPREADNRVTILARVLSWAAKDGPLSVNVLEGIDRAYQGDRSDKIWLPEHVEAFMADASPEMQLALVLALHTGQRQADIRRLAWSDYDGTHIRLRQGKARRGGRPGRLITIRCTKALQTTLDGLERRSSLILTTKTGRAFQKRYLAEQWEERTIAAGLTDLHFHDLRGTTVTLLFQAGCNLGEIVSVTGHSLRRAQEILDRYLARTSTMADSAIAKLEGVESYDFAKRSAKQKEPTDAK